MRKILMRLVVDTNSNWLKRTGFTGLNGQGGRENPAATLNLMITRMRTAKQRCIMLKEETDRQIENDRARVTRHRMAPGAHTGFHRHEYDYVIVPVTGGRMRIVEGDRESVNELTAGVAYFRPAGIEHDVSNGGDKELIFVEVEILR